MAVTLMGSAADRTSIVKENRARDKVHPVGAPFLVFLDFLMHRAPFFSKVAYKSKVPSKHRSAFLKMSWNAHCTPDARTDLMEC